MGAQHKILVLDDEPGFLQLCVELLSDLACKPEVRTASSGAHALAMLASEPFSLLMTDLRMPGMDGFQVLAVVRRKFPTLRTIVMTQAVDEQYRTRAYSMGIDLYLEKPRASQEIKLFVDCIESLLEREEQGGFRGVQSKSLMDIIQMECMSGSSTVLKITNAAAEGRIWLQNGELIDAETAAGATGEEAFKNILGWKSGNFETLPPDPTRLRRIQTNYQSLLLDTAQTVDEVRAGEFPAEKIADSGGPVSPLAALGRHKGVEFILVLNAGADKPVDQWACENPEQVGAWATKAVNAFRALGEKLNVGELESVTGLGSPRNLGVATQGDKILCAGFNRSLGAEGSRQTLKQMHAQWVS